MLVELVEKRGGKSAKLSAKPAKSGRLDFLKKVVSETQRVKFHLLPKDCNILGLARRGGRDRLVGVPVSSLPRFAPRRRKREREGLPPVLGCTPEVEVVDEER